MIFKSAYGKLKYNSMKYLLCICLMLVSYTLPAQICNLGFSIGVSTYQGDISPLGWRISFEGASLSRGAYLTYSINDVFRLKAKYTTAHISATDKNALSEVRKDRGLHFKSGLREYALIGELKLLSLIPSLRKFRMQPYLSAGLGYFSFNPQGKYRGVWMDLQPLGTEGQGMEGYDKPYSLTQFSIPMGFGITYQINEEFVIGVELSPRWTFTDYLDDVSGTYPDLRELAKQRGEAAVHLSFPNYDDGIDAVDPSHTKRGNAGENDWYVIMEFNVAYRFDPGMYLDRRKGFQGNWRCPYE